MPFNKGNIPWNKTETNSVCKLCGKTFHIPPSRLKDIKTKRGVFCSRKCTDNYRIGKPSWNKGIKTGQIPTNAFKKGHIPANWKNGKASYAALHQWIKRKLGKPKKCEKCGEIRNIEWANKSHRYKWELNDWISLCGKCHAKYDNRNEKISNSLRRFYAQNFST